MVGIWPDQSEPRERGCNSGSLIITTPGSWYLLNSGSGTPLSKVFYGSFWRRTYEVYLTDMCNISLGASFTFQISQCNSSAGYVLGGIVCNYSFHNSQYHTVSTLNIFNYPQDTHPETNTHTHLLWESLGPFAGSGHFQPRQEVSASCSQPVTTHSLMMKVPFRKSHVACTLDSLQDRFCFFLPVNARNPLRSSAGDAARGNNAQMDPAIVSRRYTLRNVRCRRSISGSTSVQKPR